VTGEGFWKVRSGDWEGLTAKVSVWLGIVGCISMPEVSMPEGTSISPAGYIGLLLLSMFSVFLSSRENESYLRSPYLG